VRAEWKVAGTLRFSVELPADADGPAGIGGFPSSLPPLMIQRLATWARERAVAQRG
jgi:hypothetical protein